MGICNSSEKDNNQQNNNNEKSAKISMQKQLHKHWNSKSYLRNLYPNLGSNIGINIIGHQKSKT
jgi:hypothetical protein